MEATRKFINRVRFMLAGAAVLYGLMVFRIPSSATAKPVVIQALAVLAVFLVILIFVMRRLQVLPAEAILAKQPQDVKALARWRGGYMVTYTLCISIILYGVVLHFLGFRLPQIAPFFLAGFVLILFYGPRVVPSDASAPMSGPIVPR